MKYFLILFITLSSYAGQLSWKASVKGTMDSNIGQNITEVSGFYATPKFSVLYKQNANKGFGAGLDCSFENYLQKRIASLNEPLFLPWVGYSLEKGKLESAIKAKTAFYYTHDYKITKLSYRLSLENDIELQKRRTLSLNGTVMYNNYGTNSSDGMRYILQSSFTLANRGYGYKYTKPFVELELNNAVSDTASYTQFEAGLKSKLKFKKSVSILGEVSLKYKKYSASQDHPHSGDVFTPVNKYFQPGLTISKGLGDRFSASLKGKLRFKDSNMPSFDYDRHTLALTFTYRDKKRFK